MERNVLISMSARMRMEVVKRNVLTPKEVTSVGVQKVSDWVKTDTSAKM